MGKVNSMIEQNGVVYYLEEALNKQKDGFDNQLEEAVAAPRMDWETGA